MDKTMLLMMLAQQAPSLLATLKGAVQTPTTTTPTTPTPNFEDEPEYENWYSDAIQNTSDLRDPSGIGALYDEVRQDYYNDEYDDTLHLDISPDNPDFWIDEYGNPIRRKK